MLRNEKSKLQLTFNTWQSEKSNMTCNRPENISEDDFNKLLQLIQRRQYADVALTYYKLKKKALLLVWEDLTNAVDKRSEE
uniref:SJCHGC09770 protein n=1 Tax=Schistosoma japonicum TaxID=6182 RepID=Q5BQX6_SCHJA|nr:SJCHGC09770 protein [Schistosoma japonicum]